MKIYRLILLFICFAFYSAFATIIHVPVDYLTIQQGIDASEDGDTVLVHPGVYVENVNFNMHRISLASLFMITGDTSYIYTTIIDGYTSGSVITVADLPYGISKISGFTIRNGHNYSGGGIFLTNAATEISHNIIRNNSCVYNGGGIYCDPYFGGEMKNNFIADNYAGYRGGGAYFIDSNPHLIDNIILDNFSDDNGGGLYLWDSQSSDLTGNVIKGNSAEGDGGGIWLHHSGFGIVQNNVISENSAIDYGGGICCISSQALWVSNSTISRNAAGFGGGIFCDSNSSSYISNSIFWGDSATVEGDEILVMGEFKFFTYCDIQGGWQGEGNVNADPLFVDPENGDFHILEGSPCIDAGDPSSPYDPDGTMSDMGAYFYDQGFTEVIDQSQTVTTVGFWFDESVVRWQQFYPSLDNISAVELFLLKFGSPGDMIVQISDDGGGILYELSIDQDMVPTSDWIRLEFPQPIDLLPGHPYRIYVFGERPSPSPDERYTWRGNPDSHYPGRTDVYDDFPNFDYAFITYGYDLFTGIEQQDITVLPEEHQLFQNYPNPFNATTTIRYYLPSKSDVILSIYNLLGQRVKTLFYGTEDVGEHAIVWDATNFPSGIYFARLETAGQTENIKMVLLK